jgi:hypothetical protein
MATPKHRVTLTRKKIAFSANKYFCNRSIQLNELNIHKKIKNNDFSLLFYVRSTVAPKLRSF